jgi:ATP-dependent RNA helicase RhlB
MEFTELDLYPDLKRGIGEAGYTTCMPVQEKVLTNAWNGQDLYVQSQTGTGKTAAFLIVIFQRLLSEPLLHGKKAIIMVPTRELAVQVEEEAKMLAKYLPFKIGSFYGGVGYTQQTALLRDNVQILVGTPGRVLDLNQSGQMNLMDIAFLVIDEADRMFDMGFYPDLRKLIRVVPPADKRQTMLFSATLNAWVKNLAWEYTKTPYEIEIEPETVTVDEVEQVLYHVASQDKMRLLMGILRREEPESAIIFCNTKRYAEIVAKRMRLNGFEAEFIIGDLPQIKRLKIIQDIKSGRIHFLVATDVAARGLDIEDLALVVNYDLPNEAENYVHRIGRTARAGKKGKAITLSSEQDVYELPAIERYIGKKIPSENAAPELLGEDKSEGQRIHTDNYDTYSSRDAQRRDKRRGSERQEAGRGAKGRRAERRGPPRPTGEGESRAGGRGSRRGPHEKKPPEARVNLSELSLEERMAYYRQKYEKGTGEKTAARPNTAKVKAPPGLKAKGALPEPVPREEKYGHPANNRPPGQRKTRRPPGGNAAKTQQGRGKQGDLPAKPIEQKPPKTAKKKSSILSLFQNLVGSETSSRENRPKPGFSSKSKETVPKTEVLEQPLLSKIFGFFKKK